MKRIAIDMDEVIADFNPKHLRLYNQDYKDNLTLEDLKGGRLAVLRPHLASEITEYLRDPSFFRDLEVMKDSQEVIQSPRPFRDDMASKAYTKGPRRERTGGVPYI